MRTLRCTALLIPLPRLAALIQRGASRALVAGDPGRLHSPRLPRPFYRKYVAHLSKTFTLSRARTAMAVRGRLHRLFTQRFNGLQIGPDLAFPVGSLPLGGVSNMIKWPQIGLAALTRAGGLAAMLP